MNDDILEIKEALKLYVPKVKDNITIETPEDLKQKYLYHIAIDKFEKLTPNISKRAAPGEDNLIPRIHTSTNLTGCVQGYASLPDHAANSVASGKKDSRYSGFMYIYEIPFKVCLKPTKELVYDAEITDERWLITYNKKTVTYPANIIGKIIPIEVTFVPTVNKTPTIKLCIAVFIEDNKEIFIDEKNKIVSGYYMLTYEDTPKKQKYEISNFMTISKEEFEKITRKKIVLESRMDLPKYAGW